MPQNVTPVDTLPANLTAHADGDLVDGAGWLARAQTYADYLLYVRNRSKGSKDSYVESLDFRGSMVAGAFEFVIDGGPGNDAMGAEQQVSSAGIDVPLIPPMGNTIGRITSLSAIFTPSTGHSAVPTTQPRLQLLRQNSLAGTVVVVGTATLAAANVAAYEVPQLLTLAVSQVFADSDQYYARFTGEVGSAGTTFIAELLLTKLTATYARD